MYSVAIDANRFIVACDAMSLVDHIRKGREADATYRFLDRQHFRSDADIVAFNQEPRKHYFDKYGEIRRMR